MSATLLQEKEMAKINDYQLSDNEFSFNATSKTKSPKKSFSIAKRYNVDRKKPFQWFIKRMIDILGASIGIIMLSPILTLIALAIKLDSPGPVFFKQKRVGLNGKTFSMYKFRSMSNDAERQLHSLQKFNDTNAGMFKMFNDPRVTRVGKFLRKYSLDEFPQLFNVIIGEMSLVGPRPPIQSELNVYKDWHYVRFATLPGLTGMWQVSGRSNIKDFNMVVKMDFDYILNWNVLLDISLLFRTIPVVLFAKDAA